ncbi:uncharacterized protein LOC126234557 [Schistocerca nitens]|uniref:uncharacterized protein LOC126234557 n=1 Tax=Schistocerca nitens TaxID=7011 RepID=UPI0021185FB8|nr:uncharacterized protein LOC126234557 [Schistocerca nitens]XP_049799216.1 uncharacterized protein LOC126234557 [Schistocerca nitens]XP_049799217.1 uncharacterized protein LOC126234557 [Schistocerca nitens]
MAQTGEKTTLPEWIDEKFVASSLRKAESDDDLHVESMDITGADPSGGGFHGEIHRVVARVRHGSGQARKRSMIVKSLSRSGASMEAAHIGGLFLRETLLYKEMLPAVSSVLKAVEGSDWQPLAASCYHSGSLPTEYLVLEDLQESGFKVAENGKLLDREQCSLVVKCLARLHAASLLFAGHESLAGPTFKTHPLYLEGAKDFFRTYTHKAFAAVAENLGKHTGYEKYATKYRELSADIFDKVEHAVTSVTPVLVVLLHGDAWKNNLMFRYSGDQVTDVRIIDFQNCFWGTPAFDLQHFLYSSGGEEVHRHHFDQLLSEYHETLQTSLRALGFHEQADAFPLRQLLRDMDDLAIHVVCISVVAASIILAPEFLPEDAEEAVRDATTSDAYFERCTSNSKFMSHMKFLVPVLERKGAL